MGSFLLLTILYKPLIAQQLEQQQQLLIYRRFYRLNSTLCLLGGLIAALIKNQQAALLLAILAATYVFANMHLLKGIASHSGQHSPESQRALRLLKLVQNIGHFSQFIAAGYVIYILNKPPSY
ncbi:MAG: hypothetical protein OQL06_08075 [Gammaproteobacteria bacterium]|nr:hypothetical protein [Gammaproteobacteria bacterium]